MGASIQNTLDSYRSGSTLLNGLISYWKLDEVSGNAIDVVNDYDGTVTGATQNQSGKIGTSYFFDGGDNISMGENFHLQTFTICCWFKANSVSAYGGIITCFISLIGSYDLTMTDGGGIEWYVRSTGETTTGISPAGTYDDNEWHHIVGTYDGSTIRLYIAGSIIGSPVTKSSPTIDYGNNIFYVGDRSDILPFIGYIDEVGIWNRALTSTEITELHNGGSGKTYPFS
jgi:hypothetical protein